MSDFTFELDAGRACLDFANTVDSAGEHLGTYADLVSFAAQAQLIRAADAEWLDGAVGREPGAGEGVLERARNLRSAMYAIFSALAADRRPPNADLELLNVELASAEAHARLVPDGAGYAWGWQGRALDLPLWGVVRSAAEVLTSDQDRRRVRECGGTDCHWLFLDTSKNRTRQWCSMQSCGNREKARRHYRKVRGLCV